WPATLATPGAGGRWSSFRSTGPTRTTSTTAAAGRWAAGLPGFPGRTSPGAATATSTTWCSPWPWDGRWGNGRGRGGRRGSPTRDRHAPHPRPAAAGRVIAALRPHDPAPGGTTNRDGITSDPAVAGTVLDAVGVSGFRAGFDGAPPTGFADVLADLGPGGHFS